MVNFPSAVEFLVRADRELTKNQYDQDIVALLYVADRYFRETLRLQDDPEAFFSQLLASEMDFLGIWRNPTQSPKAFLARKRTMEPCGRDYKGSI
ncbi:hypothetical protein [Acidithiobacillus sp.]|uniref:hypothetical protein n=1 Tax=Acidithiobacillus sp. TaxID=1872118 RepID=UPI00262023E1|nr:hypothetical protein [Acidithiobacillus sp.]MDD5280333.1 hypothetical protein [Acidithiobacillus sp.]